MRIVFSPVSPPPVFSNKYAKKKYILVLIFIIYRYLNRRKCYHSGFPNPSFQYSQYISKIFGNAS